MDNFDPTCIYEKGWRAYTHEGSLYYMVNPDGIPHNVSRPDVWHALRAYQDEQRKKGEPIRWPQLKDRKKWYANTYEEFRFECINDMPCIDVHKNVIGGFKNFRWRPGHGPKAAKGGNIWTVVKSETGVDVYKNGMKENEKKKLKEATMAKFILVRQVFRTNKGGEVTSLALRVSDIKVLSRLGTDERQYTQIITETATWQHIKETPEEILELMKKAEEV